MKFPFYVNAGLLFGGIHSEANWLQLIADQACIADQSLEDAERALLDGLRASLDAKNRPDFHVNGNPVFTNQRAGITLREWAQQEAA